MKTAEQIMLDYIDERIKNIKQCLESIAKDVTNTTAKKHAAWCVDEIERVVRRLKGKLSNHE